MPKAPSALSGAESSSSGGVESSPSEIEIVAVDRDVDDVVVVLLLVLYANVAADAVSRSNALAAEYSRTFLRMCSQIILDIVLFCFFCNIAYQPQSDVRPLTVDFVNLAQKRAHTYLVTYDGVEFLNRDSFLSHRIAVADGDAVVSQSIVVHRHAERSADCVLTAVALSD